MNIGASPIRNINHMNLLTTLFAINFIGIIVTALLPASLNRLYKIIGLVTANLLLILSIFL